MLLEMAVADAYAIPWEFTKAQKGVIDLQTYRQHPTYVELTPGQYTDDTQRSIAHVDIMLGHRPEDLFEMYAYADSYLKAYNRDRREGYSRGYQAFIDTCKTPESFLSNIKRTKGSNGAVMGVAPLGFLRSTEHVKQAAMIQAITTHHPSTVVHAQIVALAAHFYIHYKGAGDLEDFVLQYADFIDGGDEHLHWLGQVEAYKRQLWKPTTIKASSISSYVVYALQQFSTLTEIIRDAVARGGDTDSAAASAVAVASCAPHIKNDLPQVLIDNLEPGNTAYGVEFLRALDKKLVEKFS